MIGQKSKILMDLVQTVKVMSATGALLIVAGLLGGCTTYDGQITPDGYRSVKKVCYKNKGCVVQDCLTKFVPNDQEPKSYSQVYAPKTSFCKK